MGAEDARRCLEKTGDTPFVLREMSVATENAFVPVSQLNALRREALERLAMQRAEDFAHGAGREFPEPEVRLPEGSVPPMVICRTLEQLEAARAEGVRLCWYPEDYREEALSAGLNRLPEGCWLHLPMACEQAALDMLRRLVSAHADRLGGVVLGSVGQLGMDWPVPYGAGSGVPVTNRRAAALLYEAGCAFVTASPELTGQETAALLRGHPPALVPACGYAQLMLLHHCPVRTYLGLTCGHASCRLCDAGSPDALRGTSLRDRRGAELPLLRLRLPEGCLVRLMNALPTDNLRRVRAAGFTPLTELTVETPEEAAAILRGERGGESTSGHWNRPVE